MIMSLKRRMTLLILGVSTTVLLLASLAFFSVELMRYRRSIQQEVKNLARVISIEVGDEVIRGDPTAVDYVLQSLSVFKWIAYAVIVDVDNQPVAEYFREDMYARDVNLGRDLIIDRHSGYNVFEAIRIENKKVGTLAISYELSDFKNIVIGYGTITILILIVASLIAVILSIRFQRVVSQPIRHITSSIRHSAQSMNYTLRLPAQNTNEFSHLVDALNAMMNEFQKRDEQLQKGYGNLEKMIEQRTAELKTSNEELTREISERERIEKDLISAKELAESAVRARSAFLANMSHEIRTPMNAILGFADLLEGRVRDPESRGYLESILASGNTLMRLINDILDLSKVEAGKLDIEYRAFDPRTMIKEIEQIFQPLVVKKQIAFRVDVDASLPTSVLLDEIRLRQVLLNLVGNAVKFTDNGYVQLSMFMRNLDEEITSGELVFIVEDTGVGIPRDQYQSIFDAFSQQDGQDSGKYGGTGLGLTITKRLIEMMGGTIVLDSEIGKGSIFEVKLPHVEIVNDSANMLKDDEHEFDRMQFRDARILLVDDNRLNRLLCRKYLARPEFEVLEAINGKEALDMVNIQKPDMILLDIKMPVMDGYETLRKLKENTEFRPIPVIALTASAMPDEERRMYKAGCDGYLRKPLSKQVLMREIVKYLGAGYPADGPLATETVAVDPGIHELPEETRRNLSGIIAAMEGELLERWDSIRKTYVIGDIENFAIDVKALATEHHLEALRNWADKLYHQAILFDMENVPDTLACYPGLIEILKTDL